MSAESTTVQMRDFFTHIFNEDNSGYAYIALKEPTSTNFSQEFFAWPSEAGAMVDYCLAKRDDYEVYFAPALFSERSGKKEHVLGSRVFWCEFDGNVPEKIGHNGVPSPTCRIKSSSDGHEHWYWRTPENINTATLERINKGLAYYLGADCSGWDANQILRPPGTFNHKKQREVEWLWRSEEFLGFELFKSVPEAPPSVQTIDVENLRPVQDVIAAYKLPTAAWALFKSGAPIGERSTSLMRLGYFLAEGQLTNADMMAMLVNADDRWGKFAKRSDRYKRLSEIISIARAKYPLKLVTLEIVSEPIPEFESVGFKGLLAMERSLEWLWEGLLQKGGYMLVTGPSGVGKTLLSLDGGCHLALGQDWLGRPVHADPEKGLKIGFFSLEMGLVDLKHFLSIQAKHFSPEELDTLERNFRLFPLGEPLYLNKKDERERVQRVIEREGLDGIIVDSLGSTTEDELSSEAGVKVLMDWNDTIRQELGVFSWFIHHHRKATSENKQPKKLSDVYGSQYITARATTVLALWESAIKDSLEVIPLKVRLSQRPEMFLINRTPDLGFGLKEVDITGTSMEVNLKDMGSF